jgi:integral membrane protein (TIGR01906 family)
MFERRPAADKGLLRVLLVGALVLALPVALITTTIRVAISEQALYDYSVRNYGAEEASSIPESQLIRANAEIRDYLVTDNPPPLAPQVTDSSGESGPLFSAKETAHMADVRDLVQAMFRVQVLSVVMVLAIVAALVVLWPVRVLAAGLLYGSLLTGAALGTAGIMAMTGFDSAWSDFHGIAFSNDLWQLDPDEDALIQMYPEQFWYEATMLIGLAVVFQAFLIAAASSAYLLLTRERTVAGNHLPPAPDLPGRAGHSPELPERPDRPRLAPPNPRHYVR